MDDRKKQIKELEQRKRDCIVSLDALLIRIGETLMSRAAECTRDDDSAFEELTQFRRLHGDIGDSETAIQSVEELIRTFRELEENIEAREQEENAGSKELIITFGRLGKLLLDPASDESSYDNAYIPYRDQADALRTKVFSLEERIAGLEGKDGGNVFTWVGKSAQGLVLRSFLTRAQDNLEQLYRNVGERYSNRSINALPGTETDYDYVSSNSADIENLCAEIERRQAQARMLGQELSELRDERRTVSGTMNAEGGPIKQIQTLKNHIAGVRNELRTLYRRIGAEAAEIDGVGRRQIIDSFIMPEDNDIHSSAVQTNNSILNDELAIEKLQTALSIDEENAKIEKYYKMINAKKDKIAQVEKNIMEYEESIRICRAKIDKLQGRL